MTNHADVAGQAPSAGREAKSIRLREDGPGRATQRTPEIYGNHGRLIDRFEAMPRMSQVREIERANETLKALGIRTLQDLDAYFERQTGAT